MTKLITHACARRSTAPLWASTRCTRIRRGEPLLVRGIGRGWVGKRGGGAGAVSRRGGSMRGLNQIPQNPHAPAPSPPFCVVVVCSLLYRPDDRLGVSGEAVRRRRTGCLALRLRGAGGMPCLARCRPPLLSALLPLPVFM